MTSASPHTINIAVRRFGTRPTRATPASSASSIAPRACRIDDRIARVFPVTHVDLPAPVRLRANDSTRLRVTSVPPRALNMRRKPFSKPCTSMSITFGSDTARATVSGRRIGTCSRTLAALDLDETGTEFPPALQIRVDERRLRCGCDHHIARAAQRAAHRRIPAGGFSKNARLDDVSVKIVPFTYGSM